MSDKLYYPSDQYTRCSYIAGFLQKSAKKVGLEEVNVLDVGGYKSGLEEFVTPNIQIKAMDVVEPDEGATNYIRGDARKIDAETGSYDFTIMSDTLEHIPDKDRLAALSETIRVAKYGSVICFPHFQPQTLHYESTLNTFYESLTGGVHPWLNEHIEYGLPNKASILNFLDTIEGIEYSYFTSNDLDLWFNFVMLNFIAFEQGIPTRFLFELYKDYNENYKTLDIVDGGYRLFLCIWKKEHFPKKLTLGEMFGVETKPDGVKKYKDKMKEIVKKHLHEEVGIEVGKLDIPEAIAPLGQDITHETARLRKVTKDNFELNQELKRALEQKAELQSRLDNIQFTNQDYKAAYDELVRSKLVRAVRLLRRVAKLLTPKGIRYLVRAVRKLAGILRRSGLGGLRAHMRDFRERHKRVPVSVEEPAQQPQLLANETNAEEYLRQRFIGLKPLLTLYSFNNRQRVNLLLPTIDNRSMFGGTATALTLATLFAHKLGAPLRLISTDSHCHIQAYSDLVDLFGLPKLKQVEVFDASKRFASNNGYRLPVNDKDIFMATIWWTAHLARQLSLNEKFVYLIQEYEPVFYLNGDDQLRVRDTYSFNNAIPVLNTSVLHEFFKQSTHHHVADNALIFEPAFPKNIYKPAPNAFSAKEKYRLFFYSRPGTPRNLFFRGLEVLVEGLNRGIIDPQEWDFYFVGDDTPNFVLPAGVKPHSLGKLGWAEYGEFISTVDLGLSLMDAPHPSYPPLDLIASGAVVLTNNYSTKANLDYSQNLLFTEPDTESLLLGLQRAIALAKDGNQRRKNYAAQKLSGSWEQSFAPVLAELTRRFHAR